MLIREIYIYIFSKKLIILSLDKCERFNRMQVFQMSTEEKQMMAYFPDAE